MVWVENLFATKTDSGLIAGFGRLKGGQEVRDVEHAFPFGVTSDGSFYDPLRLSVWFFRGHFSDGEECFRTIMICRIANRNFIVNPTHIR